MTRTCFGLAITTCLTCGAITAATDAAFPVVLRQQLHHPSTASLRKPREKGPAHVDAPQSFELAVVPGDRLGEGAVDIQTNDPRHGCCSVSVRSGRELAGNTTSTDPRSRRIRESRKGGHVTSSRGSQPTVYRRPARTFSAPGAPVSRGWSSLHMRRLPFGNRRTARLPTNHIPDNGPGRANESHDQGRHRQTLLPPQIPRSTAFASAGLRQRLQLRPQKAQDPQGGLTPYEIRL